MATDKLVRISLISGIFLVAFIPFVVPLSMFFPFITGKNFLFRVLVEILFGLFLILAVRDANYRPRFSWLLGAFLFFIAAVGLADLFSENPYKSFWSNYERMEGYVTFLHLFAYFVIAATILKTEKIWERLLQTWIGLSIVMGLYAVLQYAGVLDIHQSTSRLDGTLGNATYLAIYAVLNLFLAAFLFLRHPSRLLRSLYVFSIILNLFVLYQTQTRGAILGFVGGAFITTIGIAIFERENRQMRRWAIGGLSALLILVAVFFAIRETSFVKSQPTLQRLASISLTDVSSNARYYIWGLAFEGFKERPILGWGQESFNYVFNKYYDPKLYAQEQWFDRTHNVVLDWLISAGILGLLGYLSLYFLALYYVWRKGEFSFPERAVLTGMLAAYFFHNLFVFDNLVSLLMFGTFLAYLHSHATRSLPLRAASLPPRASLAVGVVPVALALSLLLVYMLNWNAYRANVTLIKAVSAQNNPSEALSFFKKALAYDSFGGQEIREQLMQYAMAIRPAQGVPDALKQEVFTLTSDEMQKMIAQAPNDTRHRLFFGTVLDVYGQGAQAEAELLKALETSPRKQTVLFQLGTHYVNVGNTAKALEIFKQAYDAAPEYPEAKLIYAMGAIYTGNLALSDQILGNQVIADDRLLRAYVAARQYDKAVEVAKARIAQDQSNGDLLLNLAAVYYQAGRRQEAIDVINAIIAARPDFKAQGEMLIEQIRTGTVQ